MRAAEATTLVDDYLRWLRENLRAAEVEGGLVISTPFLDRHSDEIEIYVLRQARGYRLTDDGYTIADLRSRGVELTNAARRDHVVRILHGYGARSRSRSDCRLDCPSSSAPRDRAAGGMDLVPAFPARGEAVKR